MPLMDYDKKSLELHEKNQGKIEIKSLVRVETKEDLSIAYTPGIGAVCKKIESDNKAKYKYTSIGKTIAVISNGTAVLGFGDIGADASYPVMEGKAVLFKEFGGLNAYPLTLDIKDSDEFIKHVEVISANFAGINLEDIKAPECFYIEKELKKKLDIPIFHDDQHGTAIVVSAALENSLKLANIEKPKIVISGAGSAGIAIGKMLKNMGHNNIFMLDSKGLITNNREFSGKDEEKKNFAINEKEANLEQCLNEADVFIGVSKPKIFKPNYLELMNDKPIIFALSNPNPEVEPDSINPFIMATGRSDHPNQINNVLAFPGIFNGALKAGAKNITEKMKVAAAKAIAESVKPSVDNIIPNALDKKVHEKVSLAVQEEARKEKDD